MESKKRQNQLKKFENHSKIDELFDEIIVIGFRREFTDVHAHETDALEFLPLRQSHLHAYGVTDFPVREREL